MNEEKGSLYKQLYFEPRLFNRPVEYQYLKFNVDLQSRIKKITVHYNIIGLDKVLAASSNSFSISSNICTQFIFISPMSSLESSGPIHDCLPTLHLRSYASGIGCFLLWSVQI